MTGKGKSRKLTRRGFLKVAAGVAAGGIAGAALDALAIEPRWLEISHPVIRVPKLPPAWDGLRIAHLTDLHHSRLVSLDFIAKVVLLANAQSPDLIALTGDFAGRNGADISGLGLVLKRLKAPLGVFAVLGNHDHWAGPRTVRQMLQTAGVKLIENCHVVLTRAGQPLVIAGVSDLWEDQPNLPLALHGAPQTAPTLLLCHNPEYADEMPPAPGVDLMLSGHTHGGQLKLPFGPRLKLPVQNPKYAAGLVQGPHCQVYVSRGIGTVGIPARFNCRPELPIISLHRDGGVDGAMPQEGTGTSR